jgi:hypothetical protein
VGILYTYQQVQPVYFAPSIYYASALSYYSISVSVNIILTVMIIARLVLCRRNIRKAMGDSGELRGPYSSIITMLVESYAPYTAACLVNLGLWVVSSPARTISNTLFVYLQVCVSLIFLTCASYGFERYLMADVTQVIAPLLVIIRVANRRALTSEMIKSGSGKCESMHFNSFGESAGTYGTVSDEHQKNLGKVNGQRRVGAENAIEEVPS